MSANPYEKHALRIGVANLPVQSPAGQKVLPTQANSSRVHNSNLIRWRLVSFGYPLGLRWLELAHEFDEFAQLEPTLTKLFCYCHVTTRWYSDNWMVYLGAWLDSWRYRLATRGCKYWFCNLDRVGLSCECRLATSFDFATWLELGVPFGQGVHHLVVLRNTTWWCYATPPLVFLYLNHTHWVMSRQRGCNYHDLVHKTCLALSPACSLLRFIARMGQENMGDGRQEALIDSRGQWSWYFTDMIEHSGI